MYSPTKQPHFSFVRPSVHFPLKRASGSVFSSFSPAEAPAHRLSFCEEDLVDFDPAEFSAEVQFHPHLKTLSPCGEDTDTSESYNKARLVSRWRNLTLRLSRTLQQQAQGTTYLTADQLIEPASVSFPTSRPSSDATLTSSLATHTLGGLSRSHTKRSTKTATESSGRSSILYDSDPFRVDPVSQVVQPCLPPKPLIGLLVEEVVDPNDIIPSPPSSCVTTPASITPSSAISSANNPLRRSLRRLKTFTKNKLTTNPKPAAELQASPVGPRDASATAVASSAPPPYLPELSFDSTPLSQSVLVHSDIAASHHERQDNTRPATQPLALSQDTHPAPTRTAFPLTKWECVDPKDLTPSPYSLRSTDFPPPESPSPAPSPSWLSRNVRDIEPRFTLYASQDQPPSPDPLPILPRSLLPVISRRPSFEFDIPDSVVIDKCPTPPHTPPLQSSLTLPSPGLLSVPSSRPSSLHHLSVLRYNRSISDRRSIRSVLSVALTPDQESGTIVADEEPTKPRFLLLLHPLQSPSPQGYELTPNPSPLSLKLPVSFLRNSVPPTPVESQEIYLPSKQAFAESVDTFPLPSHLRTVIKNISRSALNTPVMSGDALGKSADYVDWGEEYDYSGYKWFEDPPPPRPEPPPQPPAEETYAPPQTVVEQNEQFDFAMKSAPNVLYGRYKQYGQLGVLAWCSEFGELTDDLKRLGFEGNMFVSTRLQALRTCEEILKLNLDIKMQIIIMYLSSQVARLRRFLDTETQFDDYPKTDFPLDYTQYPA